jgi:hypothetical protein
MRALKVLFWSILVLSLAAGCMPEDLSTEPGSGRNGSPGGGSSALVEPTGEGKPLSAGTVIPAPVTGLNESAPDLVESTPTARPRRTADAAKPTPTFDPAAWTDLPVLPELSPRALEILADGLAKGNNPNAFSKVGDCESQASWFLEAFDLGPAHYSLGEYEAELAPVIDYYAGSHKRLSLAAKPGFTAASLLSPIWSDQEQCEKGETPLDCEYRIHRPLVAFVMVGTNDASNPETFEGHMRAVLERTIELGILPVIGTKADNVEGDHFINATIARLAAEYGLPVWNYWAAVQDLPDQGLQEDGVHLTFAAPYFDRPGAFERAWPVRNLNALQVLKITKEATEEVGQ